MYECKASDGAIPGSLRIGEEPKVKVFAPGRVNLIGD
jgi:galactokinase